MKIGDKIKKIRVEQNLTMEKLSELSGIGKSTICAIETYRSSPSLETLQSIAKALHVRCGVLIDDDYPLDYRVEMVNDLSEADRRRVYRFIEIMLGVIK